MTRTQTRILKRALNSAAVRGQAGLALQQYVIIAACIAVVLIVAVGSLGLSLRGTFQSTADATRGAIVEMPNTPAPGPVDGGGGGDGPVKDV